MHRTTGSNFIGLLATHPPAGANWMDAATDKCPVDPTDDGIVLEEVGWRDA